MKNASDQHWGKMSVLL